MENHKLKVDLSQAPWVKCECGNELFNPGMMFKKLSSLLSPTGKDELIPVDIVVCSVCGKIPSFITKNVKDIPENLKAQPKLI